MMAFSQPNEQPKGPEKDEQSGAFEKHDRGEETRELTEEEKKAKALTRELAEAEQDMRDQQKLVKESEQANARELVKLTEEKVAEILESSTAANIKTELDASIAEFKAKEQEQIDAQTPAEGPPNAEGEPTDLA